MQPITKTPLRRGGARFLTKLLVAGAAIAGCTSDPTGDNGTGSNVRSFLRYVSGRQQQGPTNTFLPADLVVRTWDAASPRGGVRVVWVLVSGGGRVFAREGDNSDAAGYATARWELGATPGQQEALAYIADGDTVHFLATAEVVGKTWTGAVSVFWSNPDNWSPVGVPTGTDDVLIPANTPRPELTAPAFAHDLTAEPGVAIQLWSHDVRVAGSLVWPGSMLSTGGRTWLAGDADHFAHTIDGTVINGFLTSSYHLVGTTTFVGGLEVVDLPYSPQSPQNPSLGLIGRATVVGDLNVHEGAQVGMADIADTLVVQGNAVFDGTANLFDGLLEVWGSFEVGAAGALNASGAHRTLLRGTQVSVLDPGGLTSFFANLTLVPSADPFVFHTIVRASEISAPAGPPAVIVSPTGAHLEVDVALENLVLDGLRVVMGSRRTYPDADIAMIVRDVEFRNSPTSGAQLTLSRPGGLHSTLDRVVFATVPVPVSGFYLRAIDADSTQPVFVVNVTNTSPATGWPYIEPVNGAVVNWGPPPPPPALCPGATRTWTGTVSNDWHSPDNWNPTGVPGQTDDVCVPAGLQRYPRVDAADAEVRDLVGEAGALISGQFNLNIYGDLNWAGTTAGNFGIVRLVGASGTVQGTMTPLLVMGNYTVSGRLTVATRLSIEPGRLTLDGHTVTVGQLEVGPINAPGTGQLVMTNPRDSLLTTGVSASVFFNGGDHTGLLTAGILQVGGNFTQFFGATSFVASGNHVTVFTAGPFGAHTVQLFSPQSRFQNLYVNSDAGPVIFNSDATVQGQLVVQHLSGTPRPTLAHTSAGVRLLTVGGAFLGGVTLSRLRLLINGGYIAQISDVSFTDFQNLGGSRLEVRHPGQATAFVFNTLSFADVPAAGGFYISAVDTDPTTPPLTITVCCSSPASGAPYVFTSNGAVVNW